MEKISAVYKIINTITGDFYIGSSKNIKQRWACHKCTSTWKKCPSNPMYLDMQKYSLGKFEFQLIEEVEPNKLKEVEQQFIEMLQPTYNRNRADGWDVERYKEYQEEYRKTDKSKEYQKQYQEEYRKTDKSKESQRKSSKKYNNQLCCYNGETITLDALSKRFKKRGIKHPTLEAKKYLIGDNDD